MLTCNDAHALIVRTIDDARLSGAERASLRRHLVSCARCRGEYETQHDVRRLLVLHIQDPLPEGFDERLSARLARTSRSLPAHADVASAPRRHAMEVEDVWRRGMRRRAWALRIAPLAAALVLMGAGTSVRDLRDLRGADDDALRPLASVKESGKGAAEPRTFTTIALPRHDRGTRRQRPAVVSARDEDVALGPAGPSVDDDRWQGSGIAVAESATAVENASRTSSETPAAPAGRERVPSVAFEPDDTTAGREHAASQRTDILPRPANPFPQARPAMPAPPAVLPDRPVPPW